LTRDALGFVDAVAEYLTPLLAARRFTCTDSSTYHVRYASSRVTLDVWHENLSYEIDVRFALSANPSSKISLIDLLRPELGEDSERSGSFQASTRDAIEHSIQRIAGLISTYGQRVLSGEETEFARVMSFARAANATHTETVVHAPIREAATMAWQRRDFAAVKRLYESMEGDLDELEARKLDYARKQVG
jgi:hypothetical protein